MCGLWFFCVWFFVFFFGMLFWIFSHSPAIIQGAFAFKFVIQVHALLYEMVCFQPLAICENRLERFIFRTYLNVFLAGQSLESIYNYGNTE